MTPIVNIHEAKTHLSSLLAHLKQDGGFVIAKAGTPVARVIPYAPTGPAPTRVGFLAGQIDVPEDFDTMNAEEIEELFS